MRSERADHTLQPTALVNEAFLRLVDQTRVQWQRRAHFCAVAANRMRRILVDHARRRSAEKRGAGLRPALSLVGYLIHVVHTVRYRPEENLVFTDVVPFALSLLIIGSIQYFALRRARAAMEMKS